jgi:hypothetical protein
MRGGGFSLDYPDFVAFVRRAAEETGQAGLLKIAELRRRAGATLPRDLFDRHLATLRDDGYVHLLTHVEPHSLPTLEAAECLRQDDVLVYWVRWIAPSSEEPA